MTDGYIPVQNAGKNLHTKVRQTADGVVHDEVVHVANLPLTAFNELAVAESTPQVQGKFPTNIINSDIIQTLTNKSGSSVASVDGLCTITVAGAAEAFSQIRSINVIRSAPGQGMRARWTAGFSAGLADSSLWTGPGDDDEMLAFGYNGTEFGVLHRRFGELEVRDITFTQGGDAGGGTFTLTMDGTPVTITVPAGSATIADICALVVAASADLFNAGRGWEVHTDDSKTVTFISLVAENATGTFSFADVDSGVTAGTFQQDTTVLTGVAPTEYITAQADWNLDPMDGTGPSGVTLAAGADTTITSNMAIENLNEYDVAFQNGAAAILFSIEDRETGLLQPVHLIKHTGSSLTPTFRNPTFHLNMIGKTDAGFTGAAQTIITASLGGFIEGKEAHFGVRHDAKATVATNGTTEVVNLVLHNEETFGGTRNKIDITLDQLTVINESTRSVLIEVFKNPTHINSGVTLTAVNAVTSVIMAGAGTGTRTGGDLLFTEAVTPSQSDSWNLAHLDIHMHPTDTFVFVVTKGSGGTDGVVTVSASWQERV